MSTQEIPDWMIDASNTPSSPQAELSTDKAWAQFCGVIGRTPDAPYPGMIEAFERHYSNSFTDKAWRTEAGVWAAAWGAATRQAQREAVAAYKAELFQKYESSTERATEAEGDAFAHGYLCGEREAVAAAVPGWIDPNNKTQARYLPHVGDRCFFACGGKTYHGHHTGGSFQSGAGVTAKHFCTWDCVWMPLPAAPEVKP